MTIVNIMKYRVYYFDFLNIIACIAVLALHHNGIVHTFDGSPEWSQSLVVEVLFYWAVPVFFMLSGATLMNYRERYDTKTFLKKRFVRTSIPFLLWSLFWCVINCVKSHEIPSVLEVVDGIIHCRYLGVYWFFMPLFGIYLLMPALSLLKDKVDVLKYLFVLVFVCDGILTPIFNVFEIEPVPIMGNSIAGPLMYVILGWLISQGHLFNGGKGQMWLLVLLSVLCFVFRYWVTYHQSFVLGVTYKGWFDYYYFTAVIPSVTIFVLSMRFLSVNISETVRIVLTQLSSCSFGIYLIHMAVLSFEAFFIDRESYVFRIIMVPVTYFICVLVVWFAKKVKFAKIVFP